MSKESKSSSALTVPRIAFAVCTFGLTVCFSGIAQNLDFSWQPAMESSCPSAPEEWNRFRDSNATQIVQASKSRIDEADQVSRAVDLVFEKCPNPSDTGSFANLKRFVQGRRNQGRRGWLMGLLVPDAQYFKETSIFTEVPRDLQDPKLLAAFSEPKRINEAIEMLENLNRSYPADQQMVFFRYTSQFLPTPDDSQVFGRVLIFVPGTTTAPEKWVQFGVPEVGRPKTQNVSVVSVRRNADGMTDVFLKDHFRMYDRPEIYLKSRFEYNGSGDSCIRCHKSGVLPLFPKPGSLAPADQPKLDFVNEKFRTYGAPGFAGYVDLPALGPGLGANDPEAKSKRTAEFLAECTVDLKFEDAPTSHLKIAKAMTCAGCHNSNEGIGNLNYPLNSKMIDSYVRAGLMPPRAKLTSVEREGLLQCLNSEYFGTKSSRPALLMNWLKGLGPQNPNPL